MLKLQQQSINDSTENCEPPGTNWMQNVCLLSYPHRPSVQFLLGKKVCILGEWWDIVDISIKRRILPYHKRVISRLECFNNSDRWVPLPPKRVISSHNDNVMLHKNSTLTFAFAKRNHKRDLLVMARNLGYFISFFLQRSFLFLWHH